MNREDVITAILKAAEGSSLRKVDAGKVYNAVMECVFNALKNGDTVRLPAIGTLSITTRKETTYRNPQTKELIKKPAHKRIKFSISKNIKDELNS